jgi:DNA processing protein
MSPIAGHPPGAGACTACLRRSWLLSSLSAPLDYCARDRWRLLELLALGDVELLEAVGGRRRAELRARYEALDLDQIGAGREQESLCRHDERYPRALSGPAAPHMLNVAGGATRLAELSASPVVAILGSTRASDYGMEMARSLARGLAAAGITVASGLRDGIAIAAHAGALEARAGTLAVTAGGLDVSCPTRRRSLHERVTRSGCAVSELPCDCRGRRWGQIAAERATVELAAIVVVVEASQTPGDLFAALTARRRGRTVAAIPGRLTSPLSAGTHALLMDGASLVRGAQDVLELLYAPGTCPPVKQEPDRPDAELEPRLRRVLERVCGGCETPDELARGAGSDGVLTALTELELMGLLARGDGGRYVPRDPMPVTIG